MDTNTSDIDDRIPFFLRAVLAAHWPMSQARIARLVHIIALFYSLELQYFYILILLILSYIYFRRQTDLQTWPLIGTCSSTNPDWYPSETQRRLR